MIIAISGDSDFIKDINNSKFTGFVHSTFNRTFNIKCFENGNLYTIACRKLDNGPNTLIINVDNMKSKKIAVNDPVRVVKNFLFIGDKLTISIDKVNIWESILPTYPNNMEILKRNLVKMKEHINIHGVGGGIQKNVIPQNSFEAEVSNMLQKRTLLLYNELLNDRISSALPHAVSLLGLGPGLTPSGDDFLTGLFSIFNIKNSPFYPYRSFCEGVLKKAKTLTNDISYMTLKKAAIGKVRESIISLLNS
ncbi:oxamate carbamoyltransferase subunit AllH family protein, partial [Neobacillus vireti]